MPSHNSAKRRAAVGELPEQQRKAEIHHRAGQQDEREIRPPGGVEEIAGRDQEPFLGGVEVVQEPGEGKNERQKKAQTQLLGTAFALTRTFSITGISVLRNCSALFL